ncbi:energy transducer TonB [Steroidobacter flavus]|uniref:Energy transducer TonB n=1 Tax=Steroidobacter flavus TaxID=1842136 RepID=A0ABV8T381_9GAMM
MKTVSPTIRRIGFGFAVLIFLAGAVLLVRWLGRGSAIPYKAPPQTVQMRLVEMPPPPPPPPPPPEQRMVEVTKQPEFTEEPPQQQQSAANEPPPGPLGLDVQGQGAGDGFSLAGRPGGNDLLGGGGGGAGSRFGWYSALVQGRISQALQQQRDLYNARYEVPALIWVATDGRIERVQLIESSGKPEIDRLLVRTIEAMPKLPQPPPQDMPQPITTRIRAS